MKKKKLSEVTYAEGKMTGDNDLFISEGAVRRTQIATIAGKKSGSRVRIRVFGSYAGGTIVALYRGSIYSGGSGDPSLFVAQVRSLPGSLDNIASRVVVFGGSINADIHVVGDNVCIDMTLPSSSSRIFVEEVSQELRGFTLENF